MSGPNSKPADSTAARDERRVGERQGPRREREQSLRRRAADCGRRLRTLGASPREAAARLTLSPRTLRHWDRLEREPCEPALRGRPCRQAPAQRRAEVRELLQELGPHASLPRLRRSFPDVARGELRELQLAERCRRRARRDDYSQRLRWRRPGAVWAMDYAEPPTPIDGVYPALFSVRDLASGKQLAWLPVSAATAEAADAAWNRCSASTARRWSSKATTARPSPPSGPRGCSITGTSSPCSRRPIRRGTMGPARPASADSKSARITAPRTTDGPDDGPAKMSRPLAERPMKNITPAAYAAKPPRKSGKRARPSPPPIVYTSAKRSTVTVSNNAVY